MPLSKFIFISTLFVLQIFAFIGGGYLYNYGYILMVAFIVCCFILFKNEFVRTMFSKYAFFLYAYLIFRFLASHFDVNGTVAIFGIFSSILFFDMHKEIIVKYPKLLNAQKILFFIIMGILSFYCVKTLLFLQTNAMGARELVSINKDDSIVIGGGFALPYALTIFIPYSIFVLKAKVSKTVKRLLILLAILFIVTILKSLYMTAIVVLVLGVVYAFMHDFSIKKKVMYLCVIIFIFYEIVIYLPLFLEMISTSEATVLLRRYDELTSLFNRYDLQQSGDINARLKLALNSINTFLENPLLGIGWKYEYNFFMLHKNGIGSHSTWFDVFARDGIFAILLILFLIKSQKENKFSNKMALNLFVILGFLNPIFLYTIVFVTFYLAPMLNLLYIHNSNNNK